MIKEVEGAKAWVYDTSGRTAEIDINEQLNHIRQELGRADQEPVNRRSVDDSYMLVATHVKASICDKVLNCEYVDFAKLLRKERPGGSDEDQQKMTIINKGGQSYWVPFTDRHQSINNY